MRDHFKTQSLDGFGARDLTFGIGAAGAALHYLQQSLRRNTGHIHRLSVYSIAEKLLPAGADLNTFANAIMSLNGLDRTDPALSIGQKLLLPQQP